VRAFGARSGMLSLKARSEDVTRDPERIFEEARSQLTREGFQVLDLMDLAPFEKDHAMIVVSA